MKSMSHHGRLILTIAIMLLCTGMRAADVAYQGSDLHFANPERGFYFGNEPPWTAPEPPGEAALLTDAQCLDARAKGYSMIQQWYCLWNYRTADMVTAAGVEQPILGKIRADFAKVRQHGLKLIVTFSYAYAYGVHDGHSDTTAYWVLRHLDQLKPVFHDNIDVLAFMVNGFIGKWGEWHHSTNGLLDGDNWKPILAKILDVLPVERMYALRYSNLKQQYFNTTATLSASTAYYDIHPDNFARIGHSNMAFLANADDWATYNGDIEGRKNYVAQNNLFAVSLGETTGDGPGAPSPSLWAVPSTVLGEFARIHYATFNVLGASDGGRVIQTWRDLGIFPEIERRLGYRWRLIKGRFPAQVQAGGRLSFSFDVHNDGWSNAFNRRPVEVVLRPRTGGSARFIATAIDPRFWSTGTASNVVIDVELPGDLAPGNYDIDLFLPDPAAGLRDRPEYAIRLANLDTSSAGQGFQWRSDVGSNWLGHTVEITGQTANQPPIVSLSAPASGTVGSAVSLSASASDSDGSVASVSFYVGSTLLSTDTSAPFAASWTPSAAGSYQVTAVATDNLGASATSSASTVTIAGGGGGVIGTGTGLLGSYFANLGFTGTPVTRTDATINFDWGGGSPISGVGVDGFTVRWAGQVQAQFAETYTFTTVSDDGVRLWVNGQQLISNWTDHAPTTNSGTITLSAGSTYDIVLEYYENGGGAVAQLLWSSASTAQQIIPTTQLYPATSSGLPAGWTAQDVGTVGLSGSTSVSSGIWTVTGSGADIWNSADGFHYAYQQVSGDVQITARVTGQSNTDGWAKAGVMIRGSIASGAAHAFSCVTPGSGVAFQRRSATSAVSLHSAGPNAVAPYWVRVTRIGNVLIGWSSADGSSWSEIGRETISMGSSVLVGLAVTSHNDAQRSTATFSDVQVTTSGVTPGGGLPAGWTSQDVGTVGAGGSAQESLGTWTVAGSGADIWNSADGFRFAYRQMSGDVRITARVAGLENTNAWAKAGVMLRSALTAGSPHGSTFATSANGVAYQRRLTTDATSGHTAGPFRSAPVWVRLERVGSTLTSSTSADGSTWTVIRSETVNLGATVSVGLAVTSHADGRVCTATFTNVEVIGAAAAAN